MIHDVFTFEFPTEPDRVWHTQHTQGIYMELKREARGPGSQYHKLASGKPKPGLSSAVQRQTWLLWDSTGGVLAQSGSLGPVLLLAGGCVVAHLAWYG